jgi:hypothetical protein
MRRVINSQGFMGLGDIASTISPSSVATDAQAAALTATLQGVNPGGNGYSAIAAPTQTPGQINSGGFNVLVADGGAGTGYAWDLVNGGASPSQAQLSQAGISTGQTNLNYTQAVALLNIMQSGAGASSTSGSSSTSSTSPCSLAFFGDTSCFTLGSTTIGKTTALVLGGAALALLLMMFGGKR